MLRFLGVKGTVLLVACVEVVDAGEVHRFCRPLG
jgi:hypothetical protein